MFFLSKNHNLTNLLFIYVITIRWLLLMNDDFVNVIQDRWCRTPIRSSPSLDKELGSWQMTNQGGFWINKISKFLLFSKIVSVRDLFFEIFCKKSLGFLKSLLITTHIWANSVGFNFSELSIFLCILFTVKSVFLCIWLTFFNFESRRVYFEIHLATLYYLPVIFEFIETVIFLVFGIMWIASKSDMAPLLAVLALRNS